MYDHGGNAGREGFLLIAGYVVSLGEDEVVQTRRLGRELPVQVGGGVSPEGGVGRESAERVHGEPDRGRAAGTETRAVEPHRGDAQLPHGEEDLGVAEIIRGGTGKRGQLPYAAVIAVLGQRDPRGRGAPVDGEGNGHGGAAVAGLVGGDKFRDI